MCILLSGSPEAKAAILDQANTAAQNGGHLTPNDKLSFLTLEELKPTGDRYTAEELDALAKRMSGKSTYVPPCDHSITTAGMRGHACLRSIYMRLFLQPALTSATWRMTSSLPSTRSSSWKPTTNPLRSRGLIQTTLSADARTTSG